MLLPFFLELKSAKVPVSLTEYLTLLDALDHGLSAFDVEGFYHLSRATLVKDERFVDRFDRVFAHVFKGVIGDNAGSQAVETVSLPDEWLKKLAEKTLTDEEKKLIEALGGFEKLMETLKERLAEQQKRHQGGSKWIGTAGTSPFGAYGYNPEGVRIGQDASRNRRAVKVWDRRDFRDLDDSREIGTRNIKVALKRLRRWVRSGADEEFDIDGTIASTARQGHLDIRMRPERRNAIKVLMLFDVGGSMDDHVKVAEELFSAARSELKHLDFYYFHNCVYEGVWKDNRRRWSEVTPTDDLIRTFSPDTKLIIVGDAAMSPYEITHPGGSVEHWNGEAGAIWLTRLLERFPSAAWINPVPEDHWRYTHSTHILRQIMQERMFPLSLDGLDRAMKSLGRKA